MLGDCSEAVAACSQTPAESVRRDEVGKPLLSVRRDKPACSSELQESYRKGVANHPDLEFCGCGREAVVEA